MPGTCSRKFFMNLSEALLPSLLLALTIAANLRSFSRASSIFSCLSALKIVRERFDKPLSGLSSALFR
jgi:hypothetical protein